MEAMSWSPYPSHDAEFLFDVRGHKRTGSLFFETTQDKNRDPILTLKPYEHQGLPSIYQIYMDCTDEYDAAMRIVGCFAHWRKLMSSPWFMSGDSNAGFTGLIQWRKDMQARDASKAKQVLLTQVATGDRMAAQYLLSYATKGDTAGLQPDAATKPKATTSRRGAQTDGNVVNLDDAFSNIDIG